MRHAEELQAHRVLCREVQKAFSPLLVQPSSNKVHCDLEQQKAPIFGSDAQKSSIFGSNASTEVQRRAPKIFGSDASTEVDFSSGGINFSSGRSWTPMVTSSTESSVNSARLQRIVMSSQSQMKMSSQSRMNGSGLPVSEVEAPRTRRLMRKIFSAWSLIRVRPLPLQLKNTFIHAVQQANKSPRRSSSAPPKSCEDSNDDSGSQEEEQRAHTLDSLDEPSKNGIVHLKDQRRSNGGHVSVTGKTDRSPHVSAAPHVEDIEENAAKARPNPEDWKNVVTVMIRKVPIRYTLQLLLEEIESAGFGGFFDFVHLPLNPHTKLSKGYAFVNFLTPQLAMTFKDSFEGRPMKYFGSQKPVTLSPATLQGYQANYRYYSNKVLQAKCSGIPISNPLFLRKTKPLVNRKLADLDGAPESSQCQRSGNRVDVDFM